MRIPEQLPPDVLATRLPVWQALSEFWLDTELDDGALASIARTLAASPYSLDDLEAIHLHEVAPALHANLASVAGEWAGFDLQLLQQRCQAHALRRARPLHRLWVRLLRGRVRALTGRDWSHVRAAIAALRETRTA
jgi:hypothetical protein